MEPIRLVRIPTEGVTRWIKEKEKRHPGQGKDAYFFSCGGKELIFHLMKRSNDILIYHCTTASHERAPSLCLYYDQSSEYSYLTKHFRSLYYRKKNFGCCFLDLPKQFPLDYLFDCGVFYEKFPKKLLKSLSTRKIVINGDQKDETHTSD